MGAEYFLEFHGESLKLFTSKKVVPTESAFFDLLASECPKKKTHLIAIQIKLIFEKFDSISNASSDWQDNLKTLLAHGLNVICTIDSKNIILTKTYFPIQFQLCLDNIGNIHFGYFHIESHQVPAGQFINFCKATEYPPGIHEYIISRGLLNSGGTLVAITSGHLTNLIGLNPKTGTISCHSEVFVYLSKPVLRDAI